MAIQQGADVNFRKPLLAKRFLKSDPETKLQLERDWTCLHQAVHNQNAA